MNLAVIPARAGSKRLPNKNIKILNGKPMIAYTIEAALRSKVFNNVMVSTESIDYAEISKNLGAEVPFLRDKRLASDKSSTWDVVVDILHNYKKLGLEFKTVCVLQPTSPLRNEIDVIKAFELFNNKDADFVTSISPTNKKPQWINSLPSDLSLTTFLKKNPSDIKDDLYMLNGAIYLLDVNYLLSSKDFYSGKSYAYVMDKSKSIDIDDEHDFLMAELLLKHS